jgi:hypothetical protein
MGSKTRRVFSLVLGLGGLVLGACGGDDSGAVRSGSDASIEGDDSSMASDSGSAGDGSSSDGGNVDGGKVTNLFPPKPECSGDTVATAMGTNPQVISALQIGAMADGLDLDHDGKPDNAMSALASVTTTPISDALNATSLLRPIEFFNVHTGGPTACVKLAVYAGIYGTDDDADGSRTSVPGGDCNDHDPAIHPGATEIVGNGKDDDCDGLADESPTNVPSSDTSDADADGVTIAAGDCDDTDPTVHAGAAEVCADGKDNDCDGVADRSVDGTGHVSACSAFSGTADIRIDPQSLDGTGKPKLSFKDGAFVIGMDGKLAFGAGPDPFVVHMPFAAGAGVDFPDHWRETERRRHGARRRLRARERTPRRRAGCEQDGLRHGRDRPADRPDHGAVVARRGLRRHARLDALPAPRGSQSDRQISWVPDAGHRRRR